MKMTELERARDALCEQLAEGGETLRKHFGNVEALTKEGYALNGVADVVTEHDRWMEEKLRDALQPLTPGIPFTGEEFGGDTAADSRWIVDPIDGTMHYIRGDAPLSTSMGALILDGKARVSAIYNFMSGDMYSAIEGQGAFHNGRQIHVSDRPLKGAIVSYESKLRAPEHQVRRQRIGQIATHTSTVSAGHEFAMVAAGKWEGRMVEDGHGFDWDFAPGALLVKEAGGVVVNVGSADAEYNYRNHDFLAVNPRVYAELTTGPDPIYPQMTA